MGFAEEKRDDKDDFWDIDKLVPKKKSKESRFLSRDPVRSFDIPASAPCTDEDKKKESGRLTFEGMKGICSFEEELYEPEHSGLISWVKIKRAIDKYDFYDGFRKAALVYFGYKTEKCEFVKFYSYMPQYSQLNKEQKNYYFYWRDMMYRGKFLKTDYSYIYLYVYEVLNLPDKIPPDEGIKHLCTLWRSYRKELPRLDLYFSEWVMDYCLVHRLECPYEYISDFIFDIVSVADFKEFYLSAPSGFEKNSVSALLAYVSDYDWRTGKYSSGVSSSDGSKSAFGANDYKYHMEGAMSLLLSGIKSEMLYEYEKSCVTVFSRQAFRNSLCTHAVKCSLEVGYHSLKSSDAIRSAFTAAVRYTENKLRFIMGVKSRIAVRDLPPEYKSIIDGYFSDLFEREKRRAERQNAPEYEKLYDAPEGELSFEGADKIEQASWQTTKRLVEDVSDDSDEQLYGISDIEAERSNVPLEDDASSQGVECDENEGDLSDFDTKLLRSVFYGKDPGCSELDFVSSVARINEFFVDFIGDIVLEEKDGGYSVIEDYYEEIENWLNQIVK